MNGKARDGTCRDDIWRLMSTRPRVKCLTSTGSHAGCISDGRCCKGARRLHFKEQVPRALSGNAPQWSALHFWVRHPLLFEELERPDPSQVSSCLPIGSSRMRFPVAAQMALIKAGANGGTPGSPTPLGGVSASTGTRCTLATRGAQVVRV